MGVITDGITKNAGRVMEYIFRNKRISRTEIAYGTGLTPAATTHITTLLIELGIISETGDEVRDIKGSGRSRKLLAVNEDYGYAGGIEMNLTGIRLVYINIAGDIIYQDQISPDHYDPDDINHIMVTMIQKSLDQVPVDKILSMGVAVTGFYDANTGQIESTNPAWKNFDLTEIEDCFSFPIWALNNIDCMAVDHYLFQRNDCPERFGFFNIGPDMHCSFFNIPKMGTEKSSYLGEVGHMIVERSGTSCECGKKGCLQTYISDLWLIKKAGLIFDCMPDSYLHFLVKNKNKITLDTILKAYEAGDPYIVRLVDEGIDYLAMALGNIFLLYNIRVIYMNSQLLQNSQLQKALQLKLKEQMTNKGSMQERILDVIPYNPFRGAIGAAGYALYKFFIIHPDGIFQNFQKEIIE